MILLTGEKMALSISQAGGVVPAVLPKWHLPVSEAHFLPELQKR
jgi:hypothetical protein